MKNFKHIALVFLISMVLSSIVNAQTIPYSKGRIVISSDGNEHDHDDWAATPFSLALLAARGLQDNLVVYTFSDHVWGSNFNHKKAKQQMLTSALEGKEQFGFDNTTFIEAVANSTAAFNTITNEINKSSKKDPLVCEVCNIEMVLVFVCFTYQYDMSKKLGLKPDEVIPSRQIKMDTS
ncbi:hypothetical protein ES705_51160 [subsurface metagenome]